MGATHSETVFRIMSPAARSGITGIAVFWASTGFGRIDFSWICLGANHGRW